ncbi:uncharacterized protein LOC127266298 [Andrographis paniculata]|uniref:uncharacterized protein LOC127266298 n=1 Tax=Andrographis paniculata TaxID=175694 RepID=UPI0021E7982C|nr:uncharacterized protein LOC127266298 [Andrographis paniculata]
MEPELGAAVNCTVGSGLESRSGELESDGSDLLRDCCVPRVRPTEADGFAVYTRRKKLKSEDVIGLWDKLHGGSGNSGEVAVGVSSNGGVAGNGGKGDNVDRVEGTLGISCLADGLGAGEDPTVADGRKSDESGIENGNSGDSQDTAGFDERGKKTTASGGPKTRKMEMKMSKKILVKGGPTTVRELFETQLLDGYPVFYNGGKRGFPLRGIIQKFGILCSCSACKGEKVVPPCQFEIHACKSYRRASQYICFENGKSLLDVVKECRKSSAKSLEETIQNFVGPMPEKESVICRNCNGSFLATSVSKLDLLCDSCMVIMNSEVDAESLKSRPLEPLLGLTMPENGEVLNSLQQKSRRGRKKRKHAELNGNANSPATSSMQISKRKKRKWKITNLVSQSASGPMRGNDSEFSQDSLKKKTQRKILKLSDDSFLSKIVSNESPSVSLQSKNSSKMTARDQKMHKLIFESGGLPDGTEVAYYSRGKKLRDGYKLGSGIICYCCKTLVSPSQFEAHAGWAARHKPYTNTYTSDGQSLHEFAKCLLQRHKSSSKKNNTICSICADGGKLVFCDSCPRSFHKECASLSSVPRGKWHCIYCQNIFQRERYLEQNANTVVAERGLDTGSGEQITNRCTRIAKNQGDEEIIACVICRCVGFSKYGFGPRTVIVCDQCEKEYHVGCLKKHKLYLKELPEGQWYCTQDCKCMFSGLQDLLNSGAQKLSDSSLDIIKKKLVESNGFGDVGFDVRWRLLNAKVASRETRVLLSQAVAVLHECFDPIVDPQTGRDFIPSMVYGRNIRGQDFSGMYCVMLIVNSTVVSAGILRLFGQDMAELPLVGTRTSYQGKGYFQALFSSIEKILTDLNVKRLVLPSTDNSKSIWINKFGFEEIPEKQVAEYKITCWQLTTFKGSRMLQKAIPSRLTTDHNQSDSSIPLLQQA